MPRGSLAWAHNREALARALDVVLPPGPIAWSSRAADLELTELPVLALGRASPVPIHLWVVRQRTRVVYICLNQLVVSFGGERVLAMPPGEDRRLPAHRCPPLDGSCALPGLEEGQRRDERLERLQARGLFEPVMLAPRVHELLRRRRQGPMPAPDEHAEILSLLFVLRFWEATNSGHLRHVTVCTDYLRVPARIREDMGREPGADGAVAYDEHPPHLHWVQVRCFPDRMNEVARVGWKGCWLHGFVQQWLAHDSQVGGRTELLWHCTLMVDDDGWTLERTLLWRREEHGSEMS